MFEVSFYLLVLTFVLCYCVSFPLIIISLYEFYKLKDKKLIKIRLPYLVLYINISGLIFILISRPLKCIQTEHNYLKLSDLQYDYVDIIEDIITSFSHYILSIIYLLRYWHLWFEMNYAVQNMNNKWKYHLVSKKIKCDIFYF